MYVERIRRNPSNKQEILERKELIYWRKFLDLHDALALYGEDDYDIDVPMTKDDVERALDFAARHEDYWLSFDTVPQLCELLRDYDNYKESGWEIVYNANW